MKVIERNHFFVLRYNMVPGQHLCSHPTSGTNRLADLANSRLSTGSSTTAIRVIDVKPCGFGKGFWVINMDFQHKLKKPWAVWHWQTQRVRASASAPWSPSLPS